MGTVKPPGILLVLKSIHQTQPVLTKIIAPELASLHESDHIFLFIFYIRKLPALDAEIDFFIFHQLAVRLKDSVCRPFIVLQIHAALCILDTKCLRYFIQFLCIRVLHLVFQNKRYNISPDICKMQFLFCHLLHYGAVRLQPF